MITEAEHQKIQEYANSVSYHTEHRPLMQTIYLREIKRGRKPLVMQFLSEVFNPSPDLSLRSSLRKRVASGER